MARYDNSGGVSGPKRGGLTSGERAALISGAAVSGAGLGNIAANSDTVNAALVRLMTSRPVKGYGDLRVPVYAGAGPLLEWGSGEAVMASRIARMLRAHGVGSYYVNTFGHQASPAALRNHAEHISRNGALWTRANEINASRLDRLRSLSTDVLGKKTNAYDLLVDSLMQNGLSRQSAEGLMRSGRLNGWTPGEVLDTFKVIGKRGLADFIAGKYDIMGAEKFRNRISRGKIPYFMTGERGMLYSSLGPGVDPHRIADSVFPLDGASSKAVNLGLLTQFQANYHNPNAPLIPGSGAYDPGFLRRSSFMRRLAYAKERRQMQNIIDDIARGNGIDPKTLSPKLKYMLISTGSAGTNAAEKLRLAGEAFKDDPNVRIIVQYGQPNPNGPFRGSLNLAAPDGVMEEINRLNSLPGRKGFVLHTPRIDTSKYGLLARTVDLHGGYGGSSSLTELMANTNPSVLMQDTYLNRTNSNYALKHIGTKLIDSDVTAMRGLIDAGMPDSTAVGYETTLGDQLRHAGRGRGDVARAEQEGIAALRDAMYKSKPRFSRDVVGRANKVLRMQRLRDRRFVDTVRKAVLSAVDAGDARRYDAMKPGVRKMFSALSRMFNRTAAGRRVGIPLAFAGALGLAGGVRALTKDR